MKRHYTTTDKLMLDELSKPGWISDDQMFECWPWHPMNAVSMTTVHNSLKRMVSDGLAEVKYFNNVLHARRLDWPASLSKRNVNALSRV